MSCEVAELPCKANANYGTWSIDFDYWLEIVKLYREKKKISYNLYELTILAMDVHVLVWINL